MTGTTSGVSDLLMDCQAHGIGLALTDGGRLNIDAPQDAPTPDLLARLKAHKAELLAMLRHNPSASPAATQSTPDAFDGPAVNLAERPAEGILVRSPFPAKPCDNGQSVCKCGSFSWQDVSIHDGQSVRRDCGRCGRFLCFTSWYGNGAGHNGQHPV